MPSWSLNERIRGSGSHGDPSPWITRWASLVPPDGPVLDLACGGGRHSWYFLQRGHPVVAVDRTLAGLGELRDAPDLEAIEVDLEDGRPFPLAGRRFAAVVVTRYLHRPLLPALVAAVAPGGALLYETFAAGNERYGKPANPDFLLRPGELLAVVAGHLAIRGYEAVTEEAVIEEAVTEEVPQKAMVQRIAALRPPLV